ncbi:MULTISPECIES: AAA family ATPase [Aeromonas]|uniref:AAA family ATPase n=1 Tax=Aeromonas TaxID=642 RepID=UPI0022E474CE|nr:AAA family ATPase [Aeromonas sp. QDB08]
MTEFGDNTASSSRATYLVTWNPTKGEPMVREGQVQLEACFSTKSQPQRGDRVYLLRRRDDLRGIVARGTVTKGSFESADRDDPSKTRHYFEYLAEETRADCVAGLLPMVLLEQLLQSSFEWRAQSTGFQIPPAEAQQLEQVWESGRGLHSLAQCAHWYQKQPEWYNDTWKPQYSARVASLAAIKAGQQPLDDSTLEWLWLTTNNSICDVRPGFLPKVEYQNNIELLRELGTLILRYPGQGAYKQVFARWSEAQDEGRFRQCYRAVIHRVFAAAAPERYTTAVNVDHCRALLDRFARDFELKTTKSRDWIELNQSIKGAMEQAGLPPDQPIDNNILAWRLFEAFANEPAMTDVIDEPVASSFDTENENMDPVMNETPLNQILFGPPGTGKTYHTINKALAILDPVWLAANEADRPALKERFDEFVKEGRIDFVTFHQSFSYEDFVEGIRAENDEGSGQLRYEVVDGVFKRLCEAAAARVTRSADHGVMALEGRRVWKMSLGNTQGDDAHIFDDCIEQGLIRLGYGGAHDYSQCQSRADVQRVLEQSVGKIDNPNDYAVTSVATLVTRMKVGDLVVVTDGNFKFRAIGEITGEYRSELHPDYDDGYAQVRPVKWLRQYSPSLPYGELLDARFSQMTLYELRSPTLNQDKLQALLGAQVETSGRPPFSPGQVFGRDYQVVRASTDLLELKKPNGNRLGFALNMLQTLAEAVLTGQITVQDIREKKAIDKLPNANLEPFLVNGYNNILAPLVDHLLGVMGSAHEAESSPVARVLVIDEINRGNVSRIFGELITLIEPSKRAGASEALSTTLPYSKQPFRVPDNLYLIGTMNTADRSLAGLDIALRRRFVFEEMPPRPDLLDGVEVEGVNIGTLLRVMNQRIELLLDRDHCLGHAYFMPLNDEPTLKRLSTIFQNQILPLLQEYFFEDWQRIAWVLNDHRKGTVDQFLQAPQVDVSALFGDQVPVGNHRQRWALNESAFARIGAYAGIIKVVDKGGPAESATTAAPEPTFEEEQVAP